MKKTKKIFKLIVILTSLFLSLPVNSQDDKPTKFTTGVDLYSSYVWRGIRNGTGTAMQPMLKFSVGPFSAGAWGSFDFHGYQETDLFFS